MDMRLRLDSLQRWVRRYGACGVLAGLLLVAFALRTYNLDWDRGHYFHPDERQILIVASTLSWPEDPRVLLTSASPLNPHFFAYGTFPIYLLRVLAILVGRWQWDWAYGSSYTLLGRLLSACFDTATVWATYLLARKVFDRRVGLLAAVLATFTVLHIQLAHFYTVDTLLVPLILLAVNKAVDVARRGQRRDGVWLGLLLGMALATKVSVLPLAVVALVAWLAFAWPSGTNHRDTENTENLADLGTYPAGSDSAFAPLTKASGLARRGEGGRGDRTHGFSVASVILAASRDLRAAWKKVGRGIVLTFGVAALCFALLEPYALIDAYSFVAGIAQEIAMGQGIYDFPYTRQYAGTWGYLYQIRQILLFAAGLPLGLLGLAGLLWLCWRVWRRPWREGWVLLTWPVLYALMQGTAYAKFIRYLLPLLPFLCLAGAAMWVRTWDAVGHGSKSLAEGDKCPKALGESAGVGSGRASVLSTHWSATCQRRFRWFWLALLVVVIASTVFYAMAFLNVYRQPHPWLQATAWLCEHAPTGSTILTEYWDDPLPLGGAAESGGCPRTYTLLTMDFHTLDTGARLEELLDAIEASDYIVISSQRLYGALLRSPQWFPLAIRYYQQLFGEHLGFRLVAAPAVYPQWAGVTLLDNPRAGLPLSTPPLLAASRPRGWVLDLGQADESFTVYDHPQPLIFARVERLGRGELESLIGLKDTEKH